MGPTSAGLCTLVSADGQAVTTAVAHLCETVHAALLESDTEHTGKLTANIPVVGSRELCATLQFLEAAANNRDDEAQEAIEGVELCALLAAVNYLDVPPLLHLLLRRFADEVSQALEPTSTSEEAVGRLCGLMHLDGGEILRVLRSPRHELNANLLPAELDESPLTDEGPLPTSEADEPPCLLSSLPGGDDLLHAALALCGRRVLCRAKLLSASWRRAVRRVMRTPMWQAAHVPLAELLEIGGSARVIRDTIQAHPHECGRKSAVGLLPLHALLASCAARGDSGAARRRDVLSVALVRDLLAAYPQAADARTPEVRGLTRAGLTPLHLAAAAAAPPPVLEVLLAAYPTGLRQKVWRIMPLPRGGGASATASDPDREGVGQIPLHLAAQAAAPPDVIAFLLDGHASGAATADYLGRLPLHCAAAGGAPLASVQLLLAAHPQAAAHRDNLGQTPFDLAWEHQPTGAAIIDALQAPISARLAVAASSARAGHTAEGDVLLDTAARGLPATVAAAVNRTAGAANGEPPLLPLASAAPVNVPPSAGPMVNVAVGQTAALTLGSAQAATLLSSPLGQQLLSYLEVAKVLIGRMPSSPARAGLIDNLLQPLPHATRIPMREIIRTLEHRQVSQQR